MTGPLNYGVSELYDASAAQSPYAVETCANPGCGRRFVATYSDGSQGGYRWDGADFCSWDCARDCAKAEGYWCANCNDFSDGKCVAVDEAADDLICPKCLGRAA